MLSLGALFSSGNGEDARKALVIRQGGVPMAFAVDRMLGQHEVVVRPLEDPLLKVLGVSGSTDLGDGKPTLMLDLLSLTTHLLAQASAKTEAVQ
jgi:two-component system, chemotaxis family, sensor kinase CheA